MKVSRRVLARHIAAELHAGTAPKTVLKSLAAYIVAHGLQHQQELIMTDIATELTKFGHVEATVRTARPLDETLRKHIVAYVKNIEDAKEVVLSEHVNPELLGGIIIETPRRRFDASVSTKLKRLKNA